MIIGITGGIGSGKSTVSQIFELLGCAVFNSDEVAKTIYFETEIKNKVLLLLGPEAYLSDAQLNKPFINSKIFSNTDLLQQLNAIIHPAVMHKFGEFVKHSKAKLILKETALLFEAHLESGCDKIIVVAANDELRIKRVMLRDKLSREAVLKKIQSQLSQEDKIKKADYVITNNEDKLVIPQVTELVKLLNSIA